MVKHLKIGLITTTINTPSILKDYAENFKKFNWKDVTFIIAGDKKTPPLYDFCSKLSEEYGYPAMYLGLEEQKAISQELYDYIPFNVLMRRNFAILEAYRMGADMIITIDDDNYVRPNSNYLGSHSIVANASHPDKINVVKSENGWVNVCRSLQERNNKLFYHRGFPTNQRREGKITASIKENPNIVVNAGLWLEAPDTDAMTWLDQGELDVHKFDDTMWGSSFALDFGTWCPFNTQNTALNRKCIPAYFLNHPQKRYDDIWASFIVKKIADHLGDLVAFGEPVIIQKRNPHSYINDLKNEMDGMERTPGLIQELNSIELTRTSYKECAYELMDKLSDNFSDVKTGYKHWLNVIG